MPKLSVLGKTTFLDSRKQREKKDSKIQGSGTVLNKKDC